MSLTRRHFLGFVPAGAALAAAKPVRKRQAPGGAPPNIVLIVADGVGAWMTGAYGNKEIRTPNLDLLARGGTRFQNHFVCTPVSSASWATLLTGRAPRQHGIADFLTPQPVDDPPQGQKETPASFASEVLLSDLLSKQSYECGFAGRWPLGGDKPAHGYASAGAEPVTERSLEFLDRRKAGQPFLLTAGYAEPHPPYEGYPQKYYDLYAKTAFESFGYQQMAANALRDKGMFLDFVGNLRKCAAAVTALDDQIPAILRKLKEKGVYDNTLVIFTSTCGSLLGRHGLWSDGLASHPINLYDEAAAVPMIWSWPGRVPAEGVRPELVSAYDLLPSLCEVTGAAVPEGRKLPGRSYAGLAMGRPLRKKERWRSAVFGDFRNTAMAREERFKLVLRNEGKGPNEFYDISTDPRERVNQYDNPEYVTVRDRMTKELEGWLGMYSDSR